MSVPFASDNKGVAGWASKMKARFRNKPAPVGPAVTRTATAVPAAAMRGSQVVLMRGCSQPFSAFLQWLLSGDDLQGPTPRRRSHLRPAIGVDGSQGLAHSGGYCFATDKVN